MKLLLNFLALFIFVSGECQQHGLDYYFSHAKNNSPLLTDYRNQMQAAQVDSQLMRATQKIQVNGISTNFYAPVIAGYGYDNIITNGAQVSAFVQASKNIITSANLATQYETIRLMKESIGNTSRWPKKISEKPLQHNILRFMATIRPSFSREILIFFKVRKYFKKTNPGRYLQTNRLSDFLCFPSATTAAGSPI